MPASHEIWWTREDGSRILSLDDNLGGSFGRIANGIGPCKITLPSTFNWRTLNPDQMIQFWRRPEGGRLSLWRAYFIRRWNPRYVDGDLIIDVYGRDAVDLLRRRIVAAYEGSANATAAGVEVDDVMKNIVTDMESDVIPPTPTAGTRDWPDFRVQPDLTIGPTIDKAYEWNTVLNLLQNLATASRAAGNEVFFTVDDVLSGVNSIDYKFRTTINQPNQDVSTRVVFDTADETLLSPSWNVDHGEEVNYVYGLGQGQTTDQNIQQVSDAARFGASKWNRCEGSASARGQETNAEVRDVARSALTEGLPRRIFGGRPVDRNGLRFGIDWHWGDRVAAKAFGFEFTPIVRKVFIHIGPDVNERVDSFLEQEV